jgi:hypothetical protein
MELSRCCTTERVMGSILVDMKIYLNDFLGRFIRTRRSS